MSYAWHGDWTFLGPGRWVALLIVLSLYFLPSIVAAIRKAKRGVLIGSLNLLLGWTVVGWIVALIWSFADDSDKEGRVPCPFCAEPIMPMARVCPHCRRELAMAPPPASTKVW